MKWFPWLLVFVLLTACFTVYAAPVAIAQGEGITITLTDEPCAFTDVVRLPYRATWKEKNRVFDGCFTVVNGLVVMYFSDKNIALLSTKAFRPATET